MSMRVDNRYFLRVGDRVKVRYGPHERIGTIVEDRGMISSGGRQLFGVKIDFDPPDFVYLEVPAEELKPLVEQKQ